MVFAFQKIIPREHGVIFFAFDFYKKTDLAVYMAN
jgi:hypothetical protein